MKCLALTAHKTVLGEKKKHQSHFAAMITGSIYTLNTKWKKIKVSSFILSYR